MTEGRGLKLFAVGLSVAAVVFFLISLGIFTARQGPGAGRLKVGRVDILGPIISSDGAVEDLKKLDEDDSVGVLLVRIDSPGGAVTPSQEIHRELMRIREKKGKRVVVSVGNLGASGGYYIASAAERIWANPGSLVGSIGVLMEFTRFSELLKKIGVGADVIKSGPYKDIGSPLREMTGDERRLLQGVIDDTQRQFVDAVAKGRGMPPERVAALADGRIFTGAQAKDLGLVDELGGLEDAILGAAKLAGIEGVPEIVKPPRKWRWRDMIRETSSLVFGGFTPGGSPGLMYLWKP